MIDPSGAEPGGSQQDTSFQTLREILAKSLFEKDMFPYDVSNWRVIHALPLIHPVPVVGALGWHPITPRTSFYSMFINLWTTEGVTMPGMSDIGQGLSLRTFPDQAIPYKGIVTEMGLLIGDSVDTLAMMSYRHQRQRHQREAAQAHFIVFASSTRAEDVIGTILRLMVV